MKNYSTAFTAEIAKEQFSFFMAIKLEFATTHYYADLEHPVHYGGNRYSPLNMKVSNINYASAGSVDHVTIEMGNADLSFSGILLNEDVRNKTVTIYLGQMDLSTNQPIAFESVFIGTLGEWEIEEDKVTITIVNELILWRKKPLRTMSATCPWIFKSTIGCNYAGGSTWCDQSYDRCSALSNSTNYGGFRFLPDLAEKILWWGRAPK